MANNKHFKVKKTRAAYTVVDESYEVCVYSSARELAILLSNHMLNVSGYDKDSGRFADFDLKPDSATLKAITNILRKGFTIKAYDGDETKGDWKFKAERHDY